MRWKEISYEQFTLIQLVLNWGLGHNVRMSHMHFFFPFSFDCIELLGRWVHKLCTVYSTNCTKDFSTYFLTYIDKHSNICGATVCIMNQSWNVWQREMWLYCSFCSSLLWTLESHLLSHSSFSAKWMLRISIWMSWLMSRTYLRILNIIVSWVFCSESV